MMANQYDLKSVKLPYLAGGVLKLFASLVEGALKGALIPTLFESAGVTWLRKQHFDEAPTYAPIHYTGQLQKEAATVPEAEFPTSPSQGKGFVFTSIHEYANAYRARTLTPEDVAKRVLEAIEQSEASSQPLRAFIAVNREDVLRQAKESTQRFKDGKPLSIFDGVPVAVKDEIDMTPYPTTVGTSFLGKTPAREDATVVARLRSAGALLIGKTNMHEIGINVTGLNPHHGTTRNPYNPAHFTGGSSSGSATAVAAGFVPVAIGADGGGSIRIPAGFCGLVGLKATYGRVSEFGAFPLDWTVAHIGPIAGSATDAALTYALIAGPDPKDDISLHQPLPSIKGWDDTNLKGLRIGIYREWFNHADKEVVAACEAMLKQFEAMGCEVKEIVIPNLEANRIAHTVTIVSEMVQGMSQTYDEHHKEHGLDVRINLALGRQFSADDYVKAQRIRTRMIAHFNKAFNDVDVILTPTTAIAAPEIKKGALPDGESDLSVTVEIMRFATAANLTGLPAITFPAGYTQKGLPIGMQAMGRAWDEVTLLRLAYAAEKVVEHKAPQVHFKVL
ncbi:MAG: amidase [Anaerolineales bacterium]|uniref:amidase n=1 Tax=Candidatus Villigracilis vicinus TaxID=3140679 RepID=UPI0031348D71|nr:amidase [Anaerolineales bacterium]